MAEFDPVAFEKEHVRYKIDRYSYEFQSKDFERLPEILGKYGVNVELIEAPNYAVGLSLEDGDFENWLNCYKYVMYKLKGSIDTSLESAILEVEDSMDNIGTDISYAKPGDIVVYTNEELLTTPGRTESETDFNMLGKHHWGIVVDPQNQIIESKWGYVGPVLEHKLDELPGQWYGDVTFYRPKEVM